MDWHQIVSLVVDISLGGIAYRAVRSLERNFQQQTKILAELTRRVERLEDRESIDRVGFRVPVANPGG